MRKWLLAIALFVEALAYSQGFNKRYDAFGWGFYQQAFNVEVVSNGYVVIGGTEDYDTIAPGIYLFHSSALVEFIDLEGNKQWEKRSWRAHHNTTVGWANCCDTIPGGGYIIGGATEDTTGLDEVYLMRFNADGDTLWTRVFGDPFESSWWIGYQVKCLPDLGFAIAGGTGDNSMNGNADGFVIRTDQFGNELWRRTYGWSSLYWDGLISIDHDANGDLFMGGARGLPDGTTDFWVQRTDSTGNILWSVSWGGPYSDGSASITTLSDGNIAVFSGIGYAPSYTAMRPYISKMSSIDGSILWEHEYGSIQNRHLFIVGKENADGDLVAAGFTFPSPASHKGIMARMSSEGDSLWMFSYFYQDDLIPEGRGQFFDVVPSLDNGFIAVGVVRNSVGQPYPPGYSQDTWVVKVDGMGCIVPGCNSVGISEQATNLQDAIHIYPNPAHGQCTVQLSLPPSVGNGPFALTLVASDGRVVRQERIAGNGAHGLALEGLAAGIYYVHIASEGKWLTGGKVVVQ